LGYIHSFSLTPKDVNMARARCRVASNKLLQILQKENLVIQEYKKKKEMKQNDQNKNNRTERIQKVRSMWTVIMETITSLTKEKEAVDYVLQGCVGQYILDGASVGFRIPRLLCCCFVLVMFQLNVYEAGKLNFLMVIQLLNEALRTLRDEICQSELTPELAYKGINVKYTQAIAVQNSSDELAEEIARAVGSELSQSDEDNGMALEDILSSMAFNPFLTRKQIPQTPENLLTEIRSSWRKAVQPDDSDIELPSPKVMREEVPVDAGPIMQEVADSRLMSSTPASPVVDFDLFLSEMTSLLCSTEVKSQNQTRISHIIESPILETSGMQGSERTGEQELKSIGNISVQNVNSGEDPEQSSSCVKRSVNTLGSCSENNSIINVLPSDHFQDSSIDRMLNQNVSPLLSSVSCKASISWILDEAFPEELDSMDTTGCASSDSDFDVAITDIAGGSKNKGGIQESKLDLQSLFSPHKALKRTASTSEEELHQAHNGGESVSCTSDKNLKPEKRDELFSPVERFTLDEAFSKTPLSTSVNERKYSLSSLLASCQYLEEMASVVHNVQLSLITKLKGKCPCILATRFCPFCQLMYYHK
uniref:HAUS6 protein n=1 Tax=Calidris pygmaea TaxID=425635 RepID=A0A8C3J4C3_9CHAR